MNIVDIINKKRLGEELNWEELEYSFLGYLNDKIESYQMSALLMAICLKGMTDDEIVNLTKIFINSGEVLDLSNIEGVKVDKHSTGGIGDKTTLIIAPIVASCGIKVAKMSGRGLGYTGGTIDKLESIPGFKTNLEIEEFLDELKTINMVVSGQTKELAPLDKKIYALRDVTGTVESYPLIASSIMSKKIASGADKILIDLKLGTGALIHKEEDAIKLKEILIKIGESFNKETRVLITKMDAPLGRCIGNSLEVLEAIDVLKGHIDNDLGNLCIELAANMISMGKDISIEEAKNEAIESIKSGKAYKKFLEFVSFQHGDLAHLSISDQVIKIKSDKDGVITRIDAKTVGEVSMHLGAGRITKDDKIDPTVGIVLHKKIGDEVKIGDVLCTLHVNKVKESFNIKEAFTIE